MPPTLRLLSLTKSFGLKTVDETVAVKTLILVLAVPRLSVVRAVTRRCQALNFASIGSDACGIVYPTCAISESTFYQRIQTHIPTL
jgi:hypothetical protein